MTEVCIVGIGIHKFGRTPERTGMQQGAFAVREALADAGVEWKDMQFAFGGSAAAGSADALVNELGLTGLQFVNVSNGCATGGCLPTQPLSLASMILAWPLVLTSIHAVLLTLIHAPLAWKLGTATSA